MTSTQESTTTRVSRRRFAGSVAAMGVVAAGAATLAPDGVRIVREPKADAAAPDSDHEHATTTSSSAQSSNDLTADEMDEMHGAGVAEFPQATEGKGGQPLEYTL